MNNPGLVVAFRQRTFRPIPILIACAAVLFSLCSKNQAPQWRTVAVERGDLNVEVTASGTANPHMLVQVGTQVSGTIAKIFVDFNSQVKKGQLVALLDTTFLHAALEDAAASLRKAQATAELAGRTATRTKALFEKGLAAQADLDQAVADYESAKASLSSASAGLDRARINLAYAYIRSPINGVVVNRNVDVGQTVAASFNTPTLFTIADDLSKIQLQASIDEADIGQIKLDQNVQFTIDAYPDRNFIGKITQIRLQPTTLQNVVSYTVMIDVDNSDLAIMPGMTANLTIAVKQATGVLKVPLAALKFSLPNQQKGGDSTSTNRRSHQGKNGSNGDSTAGHGAWSHRGMANGGQQDSTKNGATAFPTRKRDRGRIYVLENGKPVALPVKIGLSNGGYVAVEGEIKEGQQVIVAALSSSKNSTSSPLGPMGGGGGAPGMPRRF
jgi:HlyD family secretion protein